MSLQDMLRIAFLLTFFAITSTTADAKGLKIGGWVGKQWEAIKKDPKQLILPVGGAVLITACVINPAACQIIITATPK